MSTVFFADLVGSTGMFERLGDAAASRLVTQLVNGMRVVCEKNNGRVLKVLGDGLFVVFPGPADAISASIAIQRQLLAQPQHAGAGGKPVQVQIGIASGEVVEIDGDCFGDAVHCAAALADLAGAAQIMTTDKVWAMLIDAHKASLRSMGPMYLRDKAAASHVYRVEWQANHDEDATMARRSLFAPMPDVRLEIGYGDRTIVLGTRSGKFTMGRSSDNTLTINDQRVSRAHASVQWRGGLFVLVDTSSFGTWVYFGDQPEAVVLRRTECVLAGSGVFVLGCQRTEELAPLVRFLVRA